MRKVIRLHAYRKKSIINPVLSVLLQKIDPLTRIQEEIKEVVRREEEYRQLAALASPPIVNNKVAAEPFEAFAPDAAEDGVVTAQPATALLAPIDEQSLSLASSVNSQRDKEESLDEHHSDDSGISASSLKINNNNKNTLSGSKQPLKLTIVGRQEQRYIGPNCYNLTPEPPQQKLMSSTRSVPTPTSSQLLQRQFAFSGMQTKGVMQRFIASHGKVQPTAPPLTPLLLSPAGVNNNSNMNNNNNSSPTLKLNARNALAFLGTDATAVNNNNINTMNNNNNMSITNNNNNNMLSQGAIERDSEGRPLRRGYVPVEQKIQRELQDLKSRESELKRLRKLNRQHQQQLTTEEEAAVDADDDDDDDDESEVEHCYGPGKLRNAQSSMELDRESNDLELMGHKSAGNRSLNVAAVIANGLSNSGSSSGMRPAMSLAQLCDLTPEEAPSSHRLIAQWESLIKKNAESVEAAI
ncbi:CG2556 [Drosophila busckii]|uniref:CG2556 n=1 Tax=Drosophila busckii TaxID=30019 RepID=A0A0M4ESD5_DROBS|nr:CG2556 [Drosophila busckii]